MAYSTDGSVIDDKIQAATLDQLLGAWHNWQAGYSGARGYPSRAAGVGEFRISRQYDAENGALDGELDSRTMKAIDFQVSEMADPHRAAIYQQARSLACGVSVFGSPRLPQDRTAVLVIISDARDMLVVRLVGCGVM